jgi:RNA polymerase sigma factor for flagellar operon FliA
MVDPSDSTPAGGATVASTARERAELIEKYGPYVRSIAQKVRATAGAQWSLEQLVEYGNIGLLEAAERYDPRVDVNFMTRAASFRIVAA